MTKRELRTLSPRSRRRAHHSPMIVALGALLVSGCLDPLVEDPGAHDLASPGADPGGVAPGLPGPGGAAGPASPHPAVEPMPGQAVPPSTPVTPVMPGNGVNPSEGTGQTPGTTTPSTPDPIDVTPAPTAGGADGPASADAGAEPGAEPLETADAGDAGGEVGRTRIQRARRDGADAGDLDGEHSHQIGTHDAGAGASRDGGTRDDEGFIDRHGRGR